VTETPKEFTDFFVGQWFQPFPCLALERHLFWDRLEIEMMRDIYAQIKSFVEKDSVRFLNLVMLGPPGSGKSTGVKAIIEHIAAGSEKFKILDYNLSQFHSTDDLTVAFQAVTEAGINHIPVVMWDEYDSVLGVTAYGWVEQFLRAMQDGVYTTKNGDRKLPRSIFFFAGSRIRNAYQLLEYSKDDPVKGSSKKNSHQVTKEEEEGALWSKVKGRDFKSRLAYPFVTPSIKLQPESECNQLDLYSGLFRRAKAIRYNFRRFHDKFVDDKDNSLNIDFFVATALLLADYFDDLRSVENVIKLSDSEGRSSFDASCLPTTQALLLHCAWDRVEQIAYGYRLGGQKSKGQNWLKEVTKIFDGRRGIQNP
jgi:hypothetical protein